MKKQFSNLDKLTLSNDFLFKHVMLRKRICKHILEELLHTEIADITYLEAEQTIDVYPDSHGIRLDVRIADAANTHYNLEMQVKNPVNRATGKFLLPKRTRYYQAMLDTDMLQKGQDYDELSPTYIIFFCLFDFFQDSQRIYTFKKRCLENMNIELADEAVIMFLNTLGTKGDVSPDIQSLFDYINSNTITSNFTREVAETIVEIKNDKKVRDAYMTYEMRMKDLRDEAHAEGLAEGKAQGLAEGKAEGLAEGKAEGLAEGKAKEKTATAKRLLSMGLSVEDIAKATSLSVEQVEKIKAEQI